MSESVISTEIRDNALWIRLMREKEMNALNLAMIEALGEAVGRAGKDPSIRSVVITGAGRAFCAGADLKEVLRDLGEDDQGKTDFLDRIATLFSAIRALPKPVIGGLNGITMAGGLELALCCDVLIAASSARIGDGHSNFGVFPGAGGAAVLPRRIGLQNAKYLLFTGDTLPAADLKAMGLVQEVVADDALDDRLSELCARLASKSPLVLARMKEVADEAMEMPLSGALKYELGVLRRHFHSHDMQEGLKAFAEKRAPAFEGR